MNAGRKGGVCNMNDFSCCVTMKEAMFYKKCKGYVICELCPHNCTIRDGNTGLCRVRKNIGGTLYTLNYGQLSAIHVDPIEKKPLRDFMQGTKTFSIGSYGCNFHCKFCQNYSIAMEIPRTIEVLPDDIIKTALDRKLPSISYTYNEPTIYYEYMYDTAVKAKENYLNNIMVSNGYINEKPLRALLPFIDAMNIDLKTYDNGVYKDICGGDVESVLNTIEISAKHCHVEVTMLIVPTVNDSVEDMKKLFEKLSFKSPNIVVHLSRYFPNYKMYEEPTDVNLLFALQKEALKYFDKVYLGNV